RRARTLVENGDLTEELAGAKRHEDRFLATNHHPDAQFAFEHKIHGVAMLALLDDLSPLANRIHFHEMDESVELLIRELGKNLHATERTGTQLGRATRDFVSEHVGSRSGRGLV